MTKKKAYNRQVVLQMSYVAVNWILETFSTGCHGYFKVNKLYACNLSASLIHIPVQKPYLMTFCGLKSLG